jgi:hypothetical protein
MRVQRPIRSMVGRERELCSAGGLQVKVLTGLLLDVNVLLVNEAGQRQTCLETLTFTSVQDF